MFTCGDDGRAPERASRASHRSRRQLDIPSWVECRSAGRATELLARAYSSDLLLQLHPPSQIDSKRLKPLTVRHAELRSMALGLTIDVEIGTLRNGNPGRVAGSR